MKGINRLIKSKFGKNVMMIAGGTAFAQAIAFLASPIITRLYSPEDFGIASVYAAIIGIFVIYASLRYERTIPITGSKEKSINMLALSFILLCLFTLLLAIVVLIGGKFFLSLFDGEAIYEYRMLLPLGLFLLGSYEIIQQWALKEKNFKGIGRTKVSQGVFGNGIKILLGIIGMGPIGLIIGQMTSQSAGIITLGKSLLKDRKYFASISKKEIIWGLKRYRDFPIYSGLAKFIHNLTTQLPIILLATLFGKQVVGFYALANSVTSMPFSLIGTSIANVFYGEIANIGREKPHEIKILTQKLQKKLILIGSIPLITLIMFGPLLFSIVFGEEWYQAGEYARLLSVLVFFNFITTPISNVASVFEKMKETLWLAILRLLLVLLVFGLTILLSLNSYWTIGLYSIAMSINYLSIYIFAQWVINNAINEEVTK